MFALKYAYKSIIRRKRKNFITSLAIALGVALFIGAQAGGDGIVNSMAQLNLDNIGNIDITITDPTSTNGLFNQSFADLIDTNHQDLEGIYSISPRIIYTTSIYATESGFIEDGVTIRGIQPGDDGFGNFEDMKGVNINPVEHLVSGKVIISDLLEDELGVSIGDEIQFSIPDGIGNATTTKFTIAAIYDETSERGSVGASPKGQSPQLYINLAELQSGLNPNFTESISEIAITFNGIDRSIGNFDVDGKKFPGITVIKDATTKLQQVYSNSFAGAFVFSLRVNSVETMGENLALLTGFLTIFAVMLNATALLLIVNVQNMAVDDRKNQTAILRALGSSIGTIFAIFVIESAIVGLIGALLGFLLGQLVSIWMLSELSNAFGVKVSGAGINPVLIIWAVIIGMVLSIATAVLPAMNAARQGIATTLRGLEEPKEPKKGIVTLLFGVIMLPIGLMFATQVGNIFDKDNWKTYENQTTMLIGFGFTLAGLGMLLTLAVSRRLALSISGASMWGLGAYFTVEGSKRIGTGVPEDPGAWFSIILLFIVVGGTLLVSENYHWIMNSIGRILFFIVGLRAITQVTTKQMIGKRSRGVLIITILTIILFLLILIGIYTTTMRIGAVNLFDGYTDGVDLVISTDNTFNNTAEWIEGIDPSIQNVFAFRRTILPIYLVSPLDPELDVGKDVIFLPIVEVPEEMINPDADWNDVNSLELSFRTVGDELRKKTGHSTSSKTSLSEHEQISNDIFAEFYDGSIRSEKVNFGEEQIIENQTMVISSWALQAIYLDFPIGTSIYLQTITGEAIPVYIGAETYIDMMGTTNFPMFGNAILVTPSIAQHLPFDVEFPNVFLVRSSNDYHDDLNNKNLGETIERALNNLNDETSFSNENGGILVGGSATIVKDEVTDYWASNAAIGEAFATFATMGLVIGGLGMMIIAFRSVSERTREIGMMRAIGFSRKSIVFGVLIEMITVSILGLIVGFIDGIMYVESVVASDLGIPAVYPTANLIAYVLGVIVLGIIAGVIPGYNASKITPSDALRYTG